MATHELTSNEKPGTFIEHKKTGRKGVILFGGIGGYYVHFTTDKCDEFITWLEIKDYMVVK